MRNAKLWSVLLAAVLLCACVAGVLFTGAVADGAEIYGVNYTDADISADKQFQTIGEVFEEVSELVKAGTWPAGKTLEIRFTGTINAKEEGSDLIFGQKTIFTAPGQKLPITIKGMDADKASAIVVNAARIACANDYTFENLTLDNWTNTAQLFAGSGHVTLKDLKSVGNTQAALGGLFADNFTAEAYAGWTRADMEALMDEDGTILSALIFNNYSYNQNGAGNKTTSNVAAVGAEHPADNYSAAAADDATFVITPASTKAKLHMIDSTASDLRLGGYRAASPARVHTAIIEVDGGGFAQITGDDGQSGVEQNIVNGNIVVDAENAVMAGTPIRIFHGTTTLKNVAAESVDPENFDNTEYGNITVNAKNLTGGTDYFVCGSNCLTIDGKYTANIDNCKKTESSPGITYIGFSAKQGVENNISNTTLTAFYATRMTVANVNIGCEIKNTFTNVTCSGFDATGYKPSTVTSFHVDKVTNEFIGTTFNCDVYAIGKANDVDVVTTTFDSCTVEGYTYRCGSQLQTDSATIGSITNYVKETVEGKECSIDNFYGLNYANATGNVVNEISGGSINKYFYGAALADVGGTVTNKISGGYVDAGYGVYDQDGNTKLSAGNTFGGVVNQISGTAVIKSYSCTFYANLPSAQNTVSGEADITTFYGARFGSVSGNVVNNVEGGEIGAYQLTSAGKFDKDNRSYFYGMHSAAVTGEVQNNVSGGVILAYQGSNSGTATTVQNKVTGGAIGFDMATGDYAHFYGVSASTVTNVKNLFEGGIIYSVHGCSNTATADSIYNEVSGATIRHGFVGAYNPVKLTKLEQNVTKGEFKSAMYSYYGAGTSRHTSLEITNNISGGTFAGTALFGGYGGDIKSVTTTISGNPQFTNSNSCVAFAPGNNNWPGRCQQVNTTIEGGTFNTVVYGGSYSGQVTGDVRTTIKSGVFNSEFYGGNFASSKKRSSSVIQGIPGKAIEGTIYNIIGVVGETDTAPQFKKNFYGGNRGQTDAGYLINCSDCKIENTINEAIFTGTYHGGNAAAAYRTKAAVEAPEIKLYVTNNIYGGQFNGPTSSYMGAGPAGSFVAGTGEVAAKVVGGEIKNNIYGGVFVARFCGAFAENCASMTLNITNHFYGGEIQGTENNHLGCEKGTEIIGVIRNTFEDGFTTDSAYVFGAGNGIVRAPEGETYAVINVINGGEFDGFWAAGGKADLRVYGSIKTTVYGGVFNGYSSAPGKEHMNNSIMGGLRNGKQESGNVELIIEGGIFNGFVVGGTVYGTYYKDHNYPGDITVTIKGGTFKENIYALCKFDGEFTCAGKAVINVEQTAGKALEIYGQMLECDSFTANGEEIKIGAKTNIVIENLEGKLVVNQTQGWEAHDYLTIPAGSAYEIIESPDVFGTYVEDDTILVKGVAVAPVGATLRLAERLGVRIVLNQDDVDAYGDKFTYTVMLGDTTLATGGYEEIKANNYSILFDGIGLTQFAEEFVVTGPFINEIRYSIVDLAEMAQTAWKDNANWKAYADAVIELYTVYNGGENTMTPEAVALAPSAVKGELGEAIASAEASLLMSDAAGVRLSIGLTEAPESAKFVVAGKTFEAKIEGNTISADIFFAHESLADTFVISVENAEGKVYMTYTASIEAMANKLANDEENENKAKAEAFLVYIQKTVACK